MKKLTIALLIAGTAAATGFVVTKMLKNKKKTETDLFDDCENCICDEELDVVIPAEDDESCAEEIEDAAEDAVEEIKD